MSKPTWFLAGIVTLIWLVISLPFTEYSMTSLFDFPDAPPSSQQGLQKLLEDITVSANFCIISIFLLYGMNRRWYLRDEYPSWLRSLNPQARFKQVFENRIVFIITNVVLGLVGVISSIVLWFHVRILSRGLGYW